MKEKVEVVMNAIKNILSKYYDRTPATGEEFSYMDLFMFAKSEFENMNKKIAANDEISMSLTSMRLMAPLYELASMIELDGTYRNSDKTRMECEIRNIIGDAISRGFFDGKKVTEKEFNDAGIQLNAVQLMLI